MADRERSAGSGGGLGTRPAGTPSTSVCVLCQGHRRRRFSRWVTPRVVRCEECGLVSVHPQSTLDTVRRHYNAGLSSRLRYYLDAEPADRLTFTEVFERVGLLRPAGGRLLDVGSNVGTALVMAVERGWRATGVEINEEAARYCREHRGLDLVAGTLESAELPGESFDVVFMFDVIEHLLDPLAGVRRVRSLLKPGGFVVISTPDIARVATRVLQIKPAEHLFYFTAATLAALLRQADLRVDVLEPLDRHRNLTAMGDSTTLRGPLRALRPLVRVARRLVGDLVIRLPLRENLLAIAVKA